MNMNKLIGYTDKSLGRDANRIHTFVVFLARGGLCVLLILGAVLAEL